MTRSAARQLGLQPSSAAAELLIQVLRLAAVTGYESAAPVVVEGSSWRPWSSPRSREITCAVRYLPEWLYAPLAGLGAMVGAPIDPGDEA